MKKLNIIVIIPIILILIGLAVVVIYNDKPKPVEISLHDKHIIDSVNRVNLELKNAEIDSLRKVYQMTAQKSRQQAENSSRQADKYKSIANKQQKTLDSLKIVKAPCPEQLEKCEELNGTYQSEIKELETTCEQLDIEAINYSKQILLCDEQRKNDSKILDDLTDTSKMQDSVIFIRDKQLEKQVKKTKMAKAFGNFKTVLFSVVGIVGTIYLMK